MKTKFIVGLILLFFTSGCNKNPKIYWPPSDLKDGFQVSLPNKAGLDETKLKQMLQKIIEGKYKKIDSVILVKDNQLILEAYFNNYDQQKPHDLRSATKSITSILIGIAQDKKYLDQHDSIKLYLPEYKDSIDWGEKSDITIHHLLNMTGGLNSNDWDNQSLGHEEKMYRQYDWSQFILKQKLIKEPGSTFMYSTGSTVLLGRVLSNAIPLQLDEWSNKVLFDPLKISTSQWERTPDGYWDSGGHLQLTPRAMAKIGQLVLNNGQWEEKQVVSKKWVSLSTSPNMNMPSSINIKVSYGYLWWGHSFQQGDRTYKAIIAWGNGGQFIFIIPKLKMVAVFTGSNYGSDLTRQPFNILNEWIFPSVITN